MAVVSQVLSLLSPKRKTKSKYSKGASIYDVQTEGGEGVRKCCEFADKEYEGGQEIPKYTKTLWAS